ncbi:hypothetical protein [Bradyrhizobium cenepequi]|uniref:hypothetical protein n=1 Tax=Bradyrhizobium cenepequi TaxID=2821403 RepID=UPI001CE2B612|nr:hypothetical protein [Bradyrhizobium cenepequi]MCA6105806.1 hypothetical protein [Bradyrhizobium cenepequi]
MVGLVEAAPIYLNGLAALLFIFVLPGAALVHNFSLPGFSQRWLTVVVASLATNYLVVTLVAQLHLNPLLTYRILAAVTVGSLIYMTLRRVRSTARLRGASQISRSETGLLLSGVVVVALTYFNIWKHGVPNVFHGGDVSVSWNVWSLVWAEGRFPTGSYGYPQFISTLWAVTYVFTGSDIQYFAFYVYIVLIIVPLVLTIGILGRVSALVPAAALVAYVWFIAEIRQPWLRETLQIGYPDWVAAIFCFCGILLFLFDGARPQTDDDRPVLPLLSLCLLLIATSTKPLYGLFALSVLAAVCTDAVRYLSPAKRKQTIIAAIGLVLVFAAAYAMSYLHLTVRSMPNYPVAALSERLSHAFELFSTSFTIAFRLMILAGLLLCPFLPRVRWLLLPLLIGIGVWANTASYDLRNVLGFFLVSAFITVYAAARVVETARVRSLHERTVTDTAVIVGVAALSLGLTLPLALDDKGLKERFARDQLRGGRGIEFNQKIGELLKSGCTVFDSDGYARTISAFGPFRDRIQFFHYPEPLTGAFVERFNASEPCKVIVFPPGSTHPTTLEFIRATENSTAYRKVNEASDPGLLVFARASD